jgi:hypothetical protein
MRALKTLLAISVALLAAIALYACGGSGGGGNGAGSGAVSAQGTLGVSLTDMPACGFDAVNVTVRAVRVHRSGTASDTDGGWTSITLNPPRKINLLDLTNGVLETLGETPLAAGHYTQLRLVLDPNTGAGFANSVVPSGGVETALATPSAVQSGIKLIHGFDVAPGQRVDLVLDFDACRSIVRRGNGTFGLKPVIKVTPFLLNGISGFVDAALLGANVMVTAQQGGEIVQSTAPNPQTGQFLLARLAPGSYDVVFTADGRATAVITGVPVASTTSVVEISGAPITLTTSATRKVEGNATLNPASAGTDVSVAAKQTFGLSPTVTVKSVVADELAGGAYELILPYGAPQLATYSAVLPIVFADLGGVAGQYSVEASATGYTTQSANVNISAADATQDFVLVP